MRFFVIATRSQTASPDVFTPELLNSEGKRALKLLADDFIREIYGRTDGNGGVIVVEAASESEAKEKLGAMTDEMHLVKRRYLEVSKKHQRMREKRKEEEEKRSHRHDTSLPIRPVSAYARTGSWTPRRKFVGGGFNVDSSPSH